MPTKNEIVGILRESFGSVNAFDYSDRSHILVDGYDVDIYPERHGFLSHFLEIIHPVRHEDFEAGEVVISVPTSCDYEDFMYLEGAVRRECERTGCSLSDIMRDGRYFIKYDFFKEMRGHEINPSEIPNDILNMLRIKNIADACCKKPENACKDNSGLFVDYMTEPLAVAEN